MWVLKCGGKYVTPPGGERSYTERLEEAQTFRTREEAVKNSCPENEYPVEVAKLLQPPRDPEDRR